ncbi:hypothetical protein CYMTET_44403 [Cymbomonas tetramitiformis]|uniref:Uncharacterized protein n=1 Tax=Cymbomonas tetramitiformis TaxID=36881 RepID=A0AAE0C1I8_9CHLO|nr:hypothetical protein CYMTET_44403 [Cymbomonas tetramitiformis]
MGCGSSKKQQDVVMVPSEPTPTPSQPPVQNYVDPPQKAQPQSQTGGSNKVPEQPKPVKAPEPRPTEPEAQKPEPPKLESKTPLAPIKSEPKVELAPLKSAAKDLAPLKSEPAKALPPLKSEPTTDAAPSKSEPKSEVQAEPTIKKLKKRVVIFECAGGNDKGPEGFRKATLPVADSLDDRGWSPEIIFYTHAKKEAIFQHVSGIADLYIDRVNPDFIEDKATFDDMLRRLLQHGVVAFNPPSELSSGARKLTSKKKSLSYAVDETSMKYSEKDLQLIDSAVDAIQEVLETNA